MPSTPRQIIRRIVLIGICAFIPAVAYATGEGATHDTGSIVLIGLATLLALALSADLLCKKIRVPPVLGELLAGVALGNIGAYVGWDLMILLREGAAISQIMHDQLSGIPLRVAAEQWVGPGIHADTIVRILSEQHGHAYAFAADVVESISFLGAIALLFAVGLEHSPEEMMRSGGRSVAIACIGVCAPFIGVWLLCAWLLPLVTTNHLSPMVPVFIAGVLTATSVGITARIFRDTNSSQRPETKLILGAAVIDDILGVALLAVIMSLHAESGDAVHVAALVFIKAISFIGILLLIGPRITNFITSFIERLGGDGSKEIFALALCFGIAWAAGSLGLAAIVGAFMAGLILTDGNTPRHEQTAKHRYQALIEPVQNFLTPIFFLVVGMQVKLDALIAGPEILLLAAAITLVAWGGKHLSGLAAGPGMDRTLVGVGMVPRGEVGLIFAALGRQLGLLTDALLAVVILVIMITTFIAPIILARRLSTLQNSSNV